jgi:hypothetical protein
MLSMFDLPITEAVYTFTEKSGNVTHIAASTLKGLLEAKGFPVTHCEIGQSLAEALERGDLGVEPPHALSLPDEALERPGVIGEWRGAHICIDGAHRLWRRWKRGDTDFPAYVVPEYIWRMFEIGDMPGTGEEWREWNRTAQVRTPEFEALMRLLGAK